MARRPERRRQYPVSGSPISPELQELGKKQIGKVRDQLAERALRDPTRFLPPIDADTVLTPLEHRIQERKQEEEAAHILANRQAQMLRNVLDGRVVLGSRAMDWDEQVYLHPGQYYIGPDHTLEPESDV